MSRATQLIDRERDRQMIEEGYTAEHDRGHADDLARAASAYAMSFLRYDPTGYLPGSDRYTVPQDWPWSPEAYRPTPDDRVRELVKAGALIAAAIDALLAER